MVVVMKPGTRQQDIDALVSRLKELDLDVGITNGVGCTILGLVGDTTAVDMDKISINPHVERVMRVQEPYKKANRKFHPEDTVVSVGNAKIGGGNFSVIAGPCSVESEAQICAVAEDVKASGAALLRGGAFKPRTSPYSFQGMGTAGLDLLMEARKQTGLPIVTEIMDPRMAELFEREVDVVQVGARNMQNFELLKEVGKMSKPILLKRGLSNTYEEWIMSAEYIMSAGNENVILCERGVRTFETYTRNTLDVSAIPAIKQMSHLPVIVDPSHAAGMYWMVEPLALAAVAAGADGLIIEVHNDPAHAKCDGQQSLTPQNFDALMHKVSAMVDLMGKTLVKEKEARSAREQGNSELRRPKNRLAAGQRHVRRSSEQLPVAEGAQRDREARRVGA